MHPMIHHATRADRVTQSTSADAPVKYVGKNTSAHVRGGVEDDCHHILVGNLDRVVEILPSGVKGNLPQRLIKREGSFLVDQLDIVGAVIDPKFYMRNRNIKLTIRTEESAARKHCDESKPGPYEHGFLFDFSLG